MNYTQIDFDASAYPNVWERFYPLSDGTVAVLTHCYTGEGDNNYSVIVHSEVPSSAHTPSEGVPQKDWWDTVLREVGYVQTLPEAETLVAELAAC